MRVTLVDCTGMAANDPADYAACMLIFAKSTRLKMCPSLLDSIQAMPKEEKLKELQYIANTIPSSHEFVDYTFLIEGVSRGFTHQFVRSRTMSFAQQTMRILDVSEGSGWTYTTGPTIESDPARKMQYEGAMSYIGEIYKSLIGDGAKVEDARGILPTNIQTNILAKCNFRTFNELVRKRSSPRTQDEYRQALEGMKKAVLEIHPWANMFFDRTFDQAARDLDAEISSIEDESKRIRMMKLVDQMRNG